MAITILDGPMGTRLQHYGVEMDQRCWSAVANFSSPDVVRRVHQEYVDAGATVHIANTFRTQPRAFGDQWQAAASVAVRLAKETVGSHLVAGSIAPVEDCYRPDRSPANCANEHQQIAEALHEAGCDLLICETFPNVDECVVATLEARKTGLEVWASLTAGPNADLLTPRQFAKGVARLSDCGANAVLINCVPVPRIVDYLLAASHMDVRLGAYANAGSEEDGFGWNSQLGQSSDQYLLYAKRWIDAGATIIGGCCGVGPNHIAHLADNLSADR